MKIRTQKQQKRIKIGDLFFNLGIEPTQHNNYAVEFDLKVKTPYGYNNIDTLFTTEKQKQITTYFTNGKTLTTSPHHLVKVQGGEWKKVHELTQHDEIDTVNGITKIKKQIHKNKQKVLYDMTVRDVQCYYSNDITSHNSWTMVAIAATAVQQGFNVNFYTLELGEDYVGKRFDCYFTGYGIEEINKHRPQVEQIVKNLKGKLIVKEYPPKGASINTIKAHVQKCVDMGHKPDMIIIDYVDYLKPPSKSRFTERKDEIDDVFIATKGLAKELQIPILTPSQVNRTGAKDSVIEGDKAAGSYDKVMVCDIALSLSRMKEDKVLGTGRIHVMKNRYGPDGITWDAKVDTNNGHIEILGAMSLDSDNSKPAGNYKEIANKFFELENKN